MTIALNRDLGRQIQSAVRDGCAAYEGELSARVDAGCAPGTNYFCAASTLNQARNYSARVTVNATTAVGPAPAWAQNRQDGDPEPLWRDWATAFSLRT